MGSCVSKARAGETEDKIKAKVQVQTKNKVQSKDKDSEDVTRDKGKDVSKDKGKDVSKDKGKDVTKDKDSEDVTRDKDSEDVTRDKGNDVTKDKGKDVSKDKGKDVSKDKGKDVSKDKDSEDVTKDKDSEEAIDAGPGTISQSTRALYCRAEFQAVGDVLKDQRLSLPEFTRLLALLGTPEPDRTAQAVWGQQKRADLGWMTEDEYVRLMMDPELDAKTNTWRLLFAELDREGRGQASRADVIAGLQKLGLSLDESLKTKVAAMDSDSDGRISYGEFLRAQLQQ